jgi:hypothetical protein
MTVITSIAFPTSIVPLVWRALQQPQFANAMATLPTLTAATLDGES